jgi:Penicillin amidase
VRAKHTLTTVVAAMNGAATADLRGLKIVPTLERVMPTTDERDRKMMELLVRWGGTGSRLDRNLDGKIDDAGAAIMDALWPRIADVMMRPTLGPLTDQLKALARADDPATPHGSSYFGGWYGYFLRDLAGSSPVFCGGGDFARCKASLHEALRQAGDALAASQGPDPAQWHSDATRERLSFGFLPLTARWTNRPTFQQVISFDGHRPR